MGTATRQRSQQLVARLPGHATGPGRRVVGYQVASQLKGSRRPGSAAARMPAPPPTGS